jgi:hypothetical protein
MPQSAAGQCPSSEGCRGQAGALGLGEWCRGLLSQCCNAHALHALFDGSVDDGSAYVCSSIGPVCVHLSPFEYVSAADLDTWAPFSGITMASTCQIPPFNPRFNLQGACCTITCQRHCVPSIAITNIDALIALVCACRSCAAASVGRSTVMS